MDELAVLKLVVSRLEAADIPYMITGSMAMAVYAQPRMTRDLDLVVGLDSHSSERVAALFEPDFLLDPVSIAAAVRARSMFNLIHSEALVKIDFIVRKDEPYRREEFLRRQRRDLDGQPAWIVSPEDLILSKLVWAQTSRSDFQLRDVRNLLSAGVALDFDYLGRWAADLGISALLEEVQAP